MTQKHLCDIILKTSLDNKTREELVTHRSPLITSVSPHRDQHYFSKTQIGSHCSSVLSPFLDFSYNAGEQFSMVAKNIGTGVRKSWMWMTAFLKVYLNGQIVVFLLTPCLGPRCLHCEWKENQHLGQTEPFQVVILPLFSSGPLGNSFGTVRNLLTSLDIRNITYAPFPQVKLNCL